MSDKTALLFANEAFYLAFAGRDMEAMEDIWRRDGDITCIHPGWAPLFGRDRVLGSWRAILSNPENPAIQCRNAVPHTFGDSGYVICHEVISGGALIATNVFIRDAGRWYMVHHQGGASATAPDVPSDGAPATLQ